MNSQFIFILLFSVSSMKPKSKGAKKPEGSFPKLINYTDDEVDKPVFVFEGVQYDELPQHLKTIYTDCHADYIRCSRQITQHAQVCAYDIVGSWRSFHSLCELSFYNCKRTTKERKYYYIGDGYTCQHKTRRTTINYLSNSMEKIKEWLKNTFSAEKIKKLYSKLKNFVTSIKIMNY